MAFLLLVGSSAWAAEVTETYDFGSFMTSPATGNINAVVGADAVATQSGTSEFTGGDVYLLQNPTAGNETLDLNGRFAIDYGSTAAQQIRFMWRKDGSNAYKHGLAGQWNGNGAANTACHLSILNLKAGDKITLTWAVQSGKAGQPYLCKSGVVTGVDADAYLANGTEYEITADGNLDLYFKNNNFGISKVVIKTSGAEAIDSNPIAAVTGADGGNRIITITCPKTNTDGATVTYYTKDGSTPTSESTLYSGPFTITSSDVVDDKVTIKAITYKEGDTSISSEVSTFEVEGVGTPITLNAPVFTVVGMVQGTDECYYPQVEFSSDNSTLVGAPTATYDVASPYTFDGVGSITVTASADGYTSSASTFTVEKPYKESKVIDFGALTASDFGEAWTSATGAPRDLWTQRAAALPEDVTYYKVSDTSADNSAVLDGITIINSNQRSPEVYIGYGLLTPYTAISGNVNNMNFTVNGATAEDYAIYNGWNNYGGGTFNTVQTGDATFALYRYDTMVRTIKVYSPTDIPPTYAVSIAEGIEGGTVAAEPTSAQAGVEVTLTNTPAEGYEFVSYSVTGVKSNEAVTVTDGKFTMPADGVTVNATFQAKTYAVSIAEGIENGTVTAEPTSAKKGDEVTITATPAEGYELVSCGVTCKEIDQVVIVTDGKFNMPADDVTVSATFQKVPVDMTDKITNWDFTGCSNNNFPGWTIYAPNGGNTWANGDTRVEYWIGTAANGVFDYYQEIEIPDGKYTMTASMWNSTNGVAGDVVNGNAGVYGTSSGVTVFAGVTDDCDNANLHQYTTEPLKVLDGKLRLGVKNNGVMGARWFGVDWIKLTQVGDVQASDYEAGFNAALNDAKAALSAEENAVIVGEEKTALETAIEKNSEVAEETVDAYKAAIAALQSATKTFIDAREPYATLASTKESVAGYAEKYAYASADKISAVNTTAEATPASAADATSKNESLTTALRAMAESHTKAEGVEGAAIVEIITNPSAEDGTNGWTVVKGEGSGGSINVLSNEPWTSADGSTAHKYFDGGNWGASAWDVSLTQDVELAAGKYMLSAIGRASGDVALSLFAGEKKAEMPAIGAAGGLFNRGWNYTSVEFEVNAKSTVTIGVQGVTEKQYNWMSFSDFKLVLIEAIYSVNVAEGIENGTVTAEPTSAKAGDEVTLTATPAEGYELASITVTGVKSNEAVVVTDNKFKMPADDVTVSATFQKVPVDMTDKITNWDFTGCSNNNFPGWTIYAPNGGNTWANGDTRVEYWIGTAANGVFDYYQEIEIPDGKYTMTASMWNSTNGVAGDVVNGNAGVYGTSSGVTVFAGVTDDCDNANLHQYTTEPLKVLDGKLRLGVKNNGVMGARWFGVDWIKLTQVGDVQASDYEAGFNAALNDAKAALSAEENAVIVGEEKTALETAIEKNSEVAEETVDAYKAAIAALQSATKTFIDAREPYATLASTKESVAGYAEKYAYASADKISAVNTTAEATPASAADATSKNESLTTALRAMAESHTKAEGVEGAAIVEIITNPSAEDGTNGWTVVKGEGSGGSINVLSNEPWTSADGSTAHKYFDGGNWGASAWDVSLTQDVELAAGKYMLSAIGRASGDVALSLFAGEKKAEMPAIGAAGGLFNRGWNYTSVEFEVNAKSTVTIGVQGVTEKQYNWMSFSDFKLVLIEAAPEYSVNVAQTENGTVEVAPTSAIVGEEVTITATPAEGYELESITVTGVKSNEAVVVTDNKFIMPADDVTVSATFVQPTGINAASANGNGILPDGKYFIKGKLTIIKGGNKFGAAGVAK